MIEVSAWLSQGVYLAGEVVECAITFKNSSGNEIQESLALATAQIYCRCRLSVPQPNYAKPIVEEHAVSNKTTSFAPLRNESIKMSEGTGGSGSLPMSNNRIVSTTKPTILFCDLKLQPGEFKTFFYREVLPVEGPPSFRGQLLRYAYKLTIGTQRINSAISLLHIPIKVLVLQEFADSAVLNGNGCANGSCEDTSSDTNSKESHSETAFQILQVVTSQRSQRYYNITNAHGHVVKFCIFKKAYKLGEDIVGSLDFSGSNVSCIQYAVSLQSEEELTPEFRNSNSGSSNNPTDKPCLNTVSKYHDMVIGYEQVHFVLPVPLHITPSFYTELVHLKWKLHFEFVTSIVPVDLVGTNSTEESSSPSSSSSNHNNNEMDGKIWTAPNTLNVETMVWDLPIKLYPNLPSHLTQGLQIDTYHKQIL